MISASKTTYNHYYLKILRPKVTKNIKNLRRKFCECRPRVRSNLSKNIHFSNCLAYHTRSKKNKKEWFTFTSVYVGFFSKQQQQQQRDTLLRLTQKRPKMNSGKNRRFFFSFFLESDASLDFFNKENKRVCCT